MASRDAPKNQIDRQTTTPFHLKLFYRLNAFHHLSDFPIAAPAPSVPASGANAIGAHSPPPPPPLPPHLQIYTWPSCTLRELAHLLFSALPDLFPDPAVGTRLSFRLIYPDTRGAATSGVLGSETRGRYLSKEMGSVVIAPRESAEHDDLENGNGPGPRGGFRVQGDDADRTLQDVRFVIGDYVDCAIQPPLEDGSVAPPLSGRGSVIGGPGMRAFGGPRENGYGRSSRGGPRGGNGGGGVPPGDWRRGERVPDGGGRSGYGGGRRGSRPY
ncbi:Sin3 associated polypeptide p18-domain-containing protein [Thermoascus aurantiacus ATCC 26904]